MRTFDQSDKSKKTVDSMIVNKKEEKKAKGKENKPVKSKSNSRLMVSMKQFKIVFWKEIFTYSFELV